MLNFLGALSIGTETIHGTTYTMAAEVGLFSRNIVVKGSDENVSDSFGARILIGLKTDLSADLPIGIVGLC